MQVSTSTVTEGYIRASLFLDLLVCMDMRPPWKSQFMGCKPIWALFLLLSHQSCDQVNVHLKFPSSLPFFKNSAVLGEADREGRMPWVYSTLVGSHCSSWILANHPTHHAGKCCSFPRMTRLKGLEAEQSG